MSTTELHSRTRPCYDKTDVYILYILPAQDDVDSVVMVWYEVLHTGVQT